MLTVLVKLSFKSNSGIKYERGRRLSCEMNNTINFFSLTLLSFFKLVKSQLITLIFF